jgi:hypothetical protein
MRLRAVVLRTVACVILLGLSIPAPANASGWSPGPNAASDNTYDGYIDAPSANAVVPAGAFQVSGWFVDEAAQGWTGADDIQVWLGAMNSGGSRLLAHANLGLSRPDVGAALDNPFWSASGFAAFVPADALTAGPQTLLVYAHTPGKGWWYKTLAVNVSPGLAPAPVLPPANVSALPIISIEQPTDGQILVTSRDATLSGYALDTYAVPGQGVAGSGVDRVEVYLGAPRERGGAFLGDAQLGFSDAAAASRYGPEFASAGWRLTFKPTNYDNNTYLLYVYARSAISGREDVANRFFAIRDNT